MKLRNALILGTLASCFSMSSCGGSPQIPGGLNNGNWSITGNSIAGTGQVLHLAGTMVQAGTAVVGSMRVTTNAVGCLNVNDNVSLSGSFSGDNLTLASQPTNGEVITLKLKGTGDGLSGTYAVRGGSAACDDKGTVAAAVIPPITGDWRGVIYYPDGSPTPVKVDLNLTQGAFAPGGYAPISGTVIVCTADPSSPTNYSTNYWVRTCQLPTSGGEVSAAIGDGVAIECDSFRYHGQLLDIGGGGVVRGFTSSNPQGFLTLFKSRPGTVIPDPPETVCYEF